MTLVDSGQSRRYFMTKSKSLKIRPTALFGALLLFAFAPAAISGQPSNPSSLKPYLTCKFDDGLKIVETSRHRQATSPDRFRTVETNGVEEKVSVVDGYRIMVAYPKTHYFANIKAENSNPDDYEKDKETVIANLKSVTSTAGDIESKEPTKISYNGFEGYSSSRKTLNMGTLGIVMLFSDTRHEILTIYLLNQEPKHRKFQTIEEWRALRDNFLNNYTACIKNNF
jgi:hypothetical protein